MTGWQHKPATALLILADGTRLEGHGIGAVGHAEPRARGRTAGPTQVGVGLPAMRSYLTKYCRAIATSCLSLGWSTAS